MKILPSLRHLMGFEAAARLGNFSRAAEELHITQSAISHQIQQLEAQLGQAMFHRVGRGVELTVAGEVLLQSVQKSLKNLRHGLNRIDSYLDPGIVVVVAPAAFTQGWLQVKIDRAQDADAELLPVFSTDLSARFIDEEDVDIHISEFPLQQANLHERPLFQDAWIVVAAPSLALELETKHWTDVKLLCLEKNLSGDGINSLLLEQLDQLHKRAIYDDQRLLVQALKNQRGIACLPYSSVAHELETGQLLHLAQFNISPSHTWWIARMEGETRSPKVRELFDQLCMAANTQRFQFLR
jgi:LysR family glycine cleavage system transcriptional activator